MSEQMQQATVVGEVRMVSLSRITPREDFNPRGPRDPERFGQLVASVRADGVLQPLLVTPDGEDDGLRLIAGEGRWLAAGEAGQTEVPVYVVEVDERTGGLELAMAENLARQDLDPVQEAHGYARLRAAGLTKKGIAERLGIAQKRVTERLEILKLPAELYPRIASGQIPPAAIKPLVSLERIHPGLAACAAGRVDAPATHPWEQPLSWTDLVSDPVGVLLSGSDADGSELPAGVYDFSEPVPIGQFSLSDKSSAELEELSGLIGGAQEEFQVRFGREALDRAAALKAAHPAKSGWAHLLVGQDIADELAADYIHACVRNQRQTAERTTAVSAEGGAADPDAEVPPSEDQAREQRRADREQAEREREHAVAHNAQLGAALFKHLARLKVDADVLKVLTAVDVAGDIEGVAARGARYAFPGWSTQVTQRGGKVKVEYLDKTQAGAKAREFVACGESMAEIAGRLFCLIAAARYADERAVARSNRSMSWLNVRQGLPYSGEVVGLIDEICAQRLPEHLTAQVRADREHQREVLAEHAREIAEARQRIDAAIERAGELSEQKRAQLDQDIDRVHGRYSMEGRRLRKQLQDPNSAEENDGDRQDADVEDEIAAAA